MATSCEKHDVASLKESMSGSRFGLTVALAFRSFTGHFFGTFACGVFFACNDFGNANESVAFCQIDKLDTRGGTTRCAHIFDR